MLETRMIMKKMQITLHFTKIISTIPSTFLFKEVMKGQSY